IAITFLSIFIVLFVAYRLIDNVFNGPCKRRVEFTKEQLKNSSSIIFSKDFFIIDEMFYISEGDFETYYVYFFDRNIKNFITLEQDKDFGGFIDKIKNDKIYIVEHFDSDSKNK